jgi:hypothetical protein
MKRFMFILVLCLIVAVPAMSADSSGVSTKLTNIAALDSLKVQFDRIRDSLVTLTAKVFQTRTLWDTGLMDSVKISDTVHVGWIAATRTIDTIKYYGARGQSLTARLCMVDSLYQLTGNIVLVDTTTCIWQNVTRSAAVAGGTFALTAGKELRLVFTTVGVMPKQFGVAIIGH